MCTYTFAFNFLRFWVLCSNRKLCIKNSFYPLITCHYYGISQWFHGYTYIYAYMHVCIHLSIYTWICISIIWNVHSAFLLIIERHKYSMLCLKKLQISGFAAFSFNFAYFLQLASKEFLLGSIFMVLRLFKVYQIIYFFTGFLSFWAEYPVVYNIFKRYARISIAYIIKYSWLCFFR